MLELHSWDHCSDCCNNCFLTFCLGCSSIWGLWPGLEDLFCKEPHIHIVKIILGFQSHRTEALDMIWGIAKSFGGDIAKEGSTALLLSIYLSSGCLEETSD